MIPSPKAFIWGVYVAPEVRGRGVGRTLMEAAIARARGWPELQQIHLAVTVTNEPARQLYRSLGFQVYGVEPAALKVDGRGLDEEHMLLRQDARHGHHESGARGGTRSSH